MNRSRDIWLLRWMTSVTKEIDLIDRYLSCALLIEDESCKLSQMRTVQVIVWQWWLFHEINKLIIFSAVVVRKLMLADTNFFSPNLASWLWIVKIYKKYSPRFFAEKFCGENSRSWIDPGHRGHPESLGSNTSGPGSTHMLPTSVQVLSLLITLNLSCKYVISQQIDIVAGRGSELTRACWVHRDGVSTNSRSLEDVSCIGGLHLLRRDNLC